MSRRLVMVLRMLYLPCLTSDVLAAEPWWTLTETQLKHRRQHHQRLTASQNAPTKMLASRQMLVEKTKPTTHRGLMLHVQPAPGLR
jgi:hypothetical protein